MALAYYYGRPLALDLSRRDGNNSLDIGTVTLTRIGKELLRLCCNCGRRRLVT